ncbi:MAG: FG-GAP-like repeat-containing protein [Pseudomonadota bacterium]
MMRNVDMSTRAPFPGVVVFVLAALFCSVANAADRVGAISGDFSVDAIGSATYSIPIHVVPASGGVRPDVALTYSSGATRGWAGEGWGLSGFSSIERCAQTVAQDQNVTAVENSVNDRFCLDGVRLVLESGAYGEDGSTYRTEIDQALRITAHQVGAQAPAYFELRYANGSRVLYGETASSRIEVQGAGASGPVRSWLIDRLIDQFGNQIRYRYSEDNASGEVTPAKIEWGENASASPTPGFRYRLHFVWEDRPSSDTWVSYRAGAKHTLSKRLRSIRSQYINNGNHQFIRIYKLNYEAAVGGDSGRSRLESIQECNDFGGVCLPLTRLEWQRGSYGWDTVGSISASTSNRTETTRVGDVNNDGRQDILVAGVGENPTWSVLVAGVDNFQEISTPVSAAAADDTYVIDYNGDGASDILVPDGTWKVHVGDNSGNLSSGSIDTLVPVEGLTYGVRIADFDGDGLDDLLYGLEDGIYLRRRDSTGAASFTASEAVGARFFVDGTTAYYSHLRDSRLVDFDGDGRNDLIVRTNPGVPQWNSAPGVYDCTVELDWTSASGTSWDVQRQRPAGTWSTILDAHPSTSYVDEPGVGGFNYQVRARTGDAVSDWSAPLAVDTEVGGCGGIPEAPRSHAAAFGPQDPIDGNWTLLRFDEGPSGGQFEGIATLSDVANPLPIDLNGDALTDLAYTRDGTWRTRLSNGVSFQEEVDSGFASTGAGSAFVADVNRDGRQDVVFYQQVGGSIEFVVLRSDGEGLISSTAELQVSVGDAESYGDPGRVRVLDGNGDGYRDIALYDPGVSGWKLHAHNSEPADLLTRITDGFAAPGTGGGNEILISYASLPDVAGYQANGAEFPVQRNYCGPVRVVTDVTRNDGVGGQYSQTHTYLDGKINNQGRGFLGFRVRSITDTRDVPRVFHEYRQDFPFIGLPELVQHEKVIGGIVESTTIAYESKSLSHSEGTTQLIWAKTESTERYEVGGPYDGQRISTTRTDIPLGGINTAPGGYGEVLQRTVTVTPGWVGGDTFVTDVHATYETQGPDPCVMPKRVAVTRSSPQSIDTRTVESVTFDSTTCTVVEFHENVDHAPDYSIRKTKMLRDAFGNVVQHEVWGGDGGVNSIGPTRTTQVDYDAYGQFPIATKIDSVSPGGANLQQAFSWNYNLGKAHTVTDFGGLQTQAIYDTFGRLTAMISPDGTYVESVLDWCAHNDPYACTQGGVAVATTTRHSGPYPVGLGEAEHTAVVDVLGRRVGHYSNQAGAIHHYPGVSYRYDDRGNVVARSSPTRSNLAPTYWTTYEYDFLGRVEEVRSPVAEDGRVATTAVEYLLNEAVITNPIGAKRKVSQDALGRTVATIDPDPITGAATTSPTHYRYTPFDELERVIGPAGHSTVRTFDGLGRITSIDDPNSGLWVFDYNVFDEVTSHTTPNNDTTTYLYDGAGRLGFRQGPDNWTAWAYVAAGTAKGKLLQILYETRTGGAVETETFSYDQLGRQHKHASNLQQGASFTYSYDELSRLKTVTYPHLAGPTPYEVTYGYDSRGRVSTVDDSDGDRVFQAASSYPYSLTGALNNFTLGNGIAVSHGYDAASGIQRVSRSTAADGTLLHRDKAVSWDNNLNILERKDSQDNDTTNVRDTATYDFMGRVSSVSTKLNGVSQGTEYFDYDARGNITYKSYVGNYLFEGSQPDQVTTISGGIRDITYAYTANGNVWQKTESTIFDPVTRTTNFEWTSFDRPSEIERDGDRVTYSYNSSREPLEVISETAEGETHSFWYHPNGLAVGQSLPLPDAAYYIKVEGQVIGAKQTLSNIKSYYHRDTLGSVVTYTTSASEGVFREVRYDAFGKRRNLDGFPDHDDTWLYDADDYHPGYTGHQQRDLVGLTHMKARMYDPITARFMSVDPAVRDVFDSRSRNGYSYVENSPLTYTDPTGTLTNRDDYDDVFRFPFVFTTGFSFRSLPFRSIGFVQGPEVPQVRPASATAAYLANLDTTELGGIRGFSAGSQQAAGARAADLADLRARIDDFTQDTPAGFFAFFAGRVLQEFFIVPAEEAAQAYRDGEIGEVAWAVGGGFIKPIRLLDKIEDRIPGKGAPDVPDDTVSVFHGSINDATKIRNQGLDPARKPTFVTRDRRAAESAVGPNRVEQVTDSGIIESRIPRSDFVRVLEPTERAFPGFFPDRFDSTEIVLRTDEAIEIFNKGIIK